MVLNEAEAPLQDVQVWAKLSRCDNFRDKIEGDWFELPSGNALVHVND
jgi:hypothetical protein